MIVTLIKTVDHSSSPEVARSNLTAGGGGGGGGVQSAVEELNE